ncbi:hypothetical protein Pelo_7336 [Pelomyxa schiedti]|nr:hypothetical protein Pelo_7336 [Pelomyxa schiedti]
MLKHRGKEKFRIEFTVTVQKLIGMRDYPSSVVFLSWRRGSKKKTGTTKLVKVTPPPGEDTPFNEKISFSCTMFKDQSTKQYDSKQMSITLKEVTKKSPKHIGKLRLNLATYAMNPAGTSTTTTQSTPFVFERKKELSSSKPTVYLSFVATPLKYGNHSIAKLDSEAGPRPGLMIKDIEGTLYSLEASSAKSDTSIDSASVASDVDLEAEKDLTLDTPTDISPEVQALQEELEMVRLESFEKLNRIKEQDAELQELRGNFASTQNSYQILWQNTTKLLKQADVELRKFTSNPPDFQQKLQQMMAKSAPLTSSTTSTTSTSTSTTTSSTVNREVSRESSFIEQQIYLAPVQFEPDSGTPVTAKSIMSQLEVWKCFSSPLSATRNFFDRICGAIETVCNQKPGLPRMCYWLSVTYGLITLCRDRMLRNADEKPTLCGFEQALTKTGFIVYSTVVAHITGKLQLYLVSALLQERQEEIATRLLQSVPRVSTVFGVLDRSLFTLRGSRVPEPVVQQFFTQIFYFISAHLFNHVACNEISVPLNTGLALQLAVTRLEEWATKNNLTNTMGQLEPLTETATVLVSVLSDNALLAHSCQALSVAQLKHLILTLTPDISPTLATKLKISDDIKFNETLIHPVSF